MDLDELERRTHEQIRELQEEYRKRLEPLQKILVDIHLARPMQPITVPADYFSQTASDEMLNESRKRWVVGVLDDPEYKRAQKEMNQAYRALVDALPCANKAFYDK